jgi:hypothetical protein
MTDILLLSAGALALLGYAQDKHSIWNILSQANNSGSIDQATDKNGDRSIGNIDPNLCGNGHLQRMQTDMPPLPPFYRGPLDPVFANHPGVATPLIRNLAVPSMGY